MKQIPYGWLQRRLGYLLGGDPDLANTFAIIATPAGTSPVADDSMDTLTLTSTGSTLAITGDSSTDTVNFDIAALTASLPVVTDSNGKLGTKTWETVSVTCSHVTNTTVAAKKLQLGSMMFLNVDLSYAGATDNVNCTITLPTAINTTHLPTTNASQIIGSGTLHDASTGPKIYPLVCHISPGVSTTTVNIFLFALGTYAELSTPLSNTSPTTKGTGDFASFQLWYPI